MFNLDKVTYIKQYDAEPSTYYTYKTEKRFLGIVIRQEGVYYNIDNDYLGREIPDNHFFKDGVIYNKPHCNLYFTALDYNSYYFDAYDDVLRFINTVTSKGRWINY